jgi:hypothetical protein
MRLERLLPEVSSESVRDFLNNRNECEEPSSAYNRICLLNEYVKEFIDDLVCDYENKDLAKLACIGTYTLLEKSGEIPFVEEETISLYLSDIIERENDHKELWREMLDKNPNITAFLLVLRDKSTSEDISIAGLHVYGFLRTQAKINLFNKYEKKGIKSHYPN